ncbi:MAG: hypothetical protein NVS3B1_28410 [Marmoricola sp.]
MTVWLWLSEDAIKRRGKLLHPGDYVVCRDDKDGIIPFDKLVEQFMSGEQPYSKARRVFMIVDNGSAYRGQKSTKRLRGRYKNLVLVHTPVPASWLNQAASTSRSCNAKH